MVSLAGGRRGEEEVGQTFRLRGVPKRRSGATAASRSQTSIRKYGETQDGKMPVLRWLEGRNFRACCPNHFGDAGARLSQPQHVRQPQSPWNFVRSFGNPGCCGWDTCAPFHLGNTPFTLLPNVAQPSLAASSRGVRAPWTGLGRGTRPEPAGGDACATGAVRGCAPVGKRRAKRSDAGPDLG